MQVGVPREILEETRRLVHERSARPRPFKSSTGSSAVVFPAKNPTRESRSGPRPLAAFDLTTEATSSRRDTVVSPKYWRGGTVGPFAVAGSRNILLLRASAETKEEVKRLSPVNLSFRVLVFLLIGTGGIVVASRLVAPKKAVACCSADVCARNHHHHE